MKIRIETRFAPGDLVWVVEDDCLARVMKVQYGMSMNVSGKVREGVSYKIRYIGSGEDAWVGGNKLEHYD